MTLTSFVVMLGLAPGAYTLYAWARDQQGQVSLLTNGGAGTVAQDTASITYAPINAPVLANVWATNAYPSTVPPATSELQFSSGANVYVR